MHGLAGTKVLSVYYIARMFLHCVVDYRAQKTYLSNLSTFRQFECHIIVHKRSISSDGTFAHCKVVNCPPVIACVGDLI